MSLGDLYRTYAGPNFTHYLGLAGLYLLSAVLLALMLHSVI